ncbi:MAG: CHAT domain-containing protein, partial [Prevotella sp.]|nr:CHAT domain-containing protein [Prevotella sp.]
TDYATGLRYLANYKLSSGKFNEAIDLLTETLEIYEKTIGKEHSYYASSLAAFASNNAALGKYNEAIDMTTEALDIYEKTVGKENPEYASILASLATYYGKNGDYLEALSLGVEALRIQYKVLGKEHTEYAKTLNYLSGFYAELGNYTEAINLATRALKIIENKLGKKDPSYGMILGNLALYSSYVGNIAEAIRLEKEAMDINGKDNLGYPKMLGNLANYNCYMGNFDEALSLGMEALEINEKLFGKEHLENVRILSNLSSFNAIVGNYAEAVNLNNEAMKIVENTNGKEHPDYVELLCAMAVYSFGVNDDDEAIVYSIKTTQKLSELIYNTFSSLTSKERAMFWNKYSNWYGNVLPMLSFYIKNDSLTATAYNGTLMSKGLLLNSEIEMNNLLLESGDVNAVEKYKALQQNRTILNKLYETAITNRKMNVDSLEREVQRQEKELLELSKTYGDYTKNLSIDWRQVQEKLGKKDVAIEFLAFGVQNDNIMYAALTLTKNDDVPHLIPLFEKSELDSLLKSDYYNTSELANLVWKPLSEVLSGKENIYFAPAGELHNIAIESIPCFDGEGLMSDRWNLYRLSSTRELALIKDKNEMKDAYLYGNLKYDMDVNALEENDKKYDNGKRNVDWETINIVDSLDLRGPAQQILTPLPATKEEVENIDNSLKSQHVNSTLLTDTLGTEISLKALSGQRPNVLHIATHGFYWTESDAKKFNITSMAMLNDDNNNAKYIEDKALTRSGLFLAGAENAFRKDTKMPEGVDDGILTAKEISVLDLRGLDLVVLSACETGLGEITGDGVFGLQRGFKKAGAQTLMMSLWKVDDDATQMLMSQFYSNLAKGENKFEALKEAQQYGRTTDNGKYSDPRYWAAFILLDAID